MKFLSSLFLACGLLVAVAHAASAQKVPAISHGDLQTAIKAGTVTLLDVNGSDSFKEGRIPGAVDFIARKAQLATVLPKDKQALVVAYCGNEYCSAYLAAVTAARELGYTNVRHYAPGIEGWKDAGAKVEKG
jgi:rhodanese-related sulfurtransferase